jgi:predicted dehydrogenase
MARVVRAAVVGLGSMGSNHVRVLADLPGVTVAGVADVDPGRVARAVAGRTFAGFPDLATLLAESHPDFVSVAVPTGMHEAAALEVIAAGASVLVEKPIAGTLASGQRIAEAARAAGVKLAVGHIERFNPAVRELKARLSAGQGGRVLQIRARRVGPFPQRIRDVGVIHDLAPHDIDIMRYLLADDVVRVYAEAQRRIHTDNEDIFVGLLHFAGGTLGVLDINWLTPRKERVLTVLCEGGMFVADYIAQSLEFYENHSARAREGAIASVTEGSMTRYPIATREPLRAELEAFRDALLDLAPVAVTALDGLAALVVAEALVESARLGETIAVHPVAAS